MDSDEVDEWWLDSDSNTSVWTFSDFKDIVGTSNAASHRSDSDICAESESETAPSTKPSDLDSDRSESDIFAERDSETATATEHFNMDNSRTENTGVSSDTEDLHLHVDDSESENQSNVISVTLVERNGETRDITVNNVQTLRAMLPEKFKITPMFANPVPVDAKGNLFRGKRHRLKSGTGSLREIRKYQKSVDPLIPRMAFKRYVRDVCAKIGVSNRFEAEAFIALQEAFERYAVEIFNAANKITINSQRVTLQKKDLQLAVELLMKPWDVPSTNDGFTA